MYDVMARRTASSNLPLNEKLARNLEASMKRFTLLICAVLALLLVSPALAGAHSPTGERLGLFFSGTQEFPANTAFFVRHGWAQEQGYPMGRFGFILEVDGIAVKETYVERTIIEDSDGPIFDLLWVFNFPAGMSGVHSFEGHWIIPCQYALDLGETSHCANPNAPYEYRATEVEVTFTP